MNRTTSRTPFNARVILGVVLIGFLAFLALLYFIGSGDTGERDNNGQAHAAAPGLNGFAGLTRLLELQGYDVELSRSPSGLDTANILVLTPPLNTDAEEFAELLEKRQYQGPTVVILPKWFASGFPDNVAAEIEEDVEDGWVRLLAAQKPEWVSKLPAPYTVEINRDPSSVDEETEPEDPFQIFTGAAQGTGSNWTGFGVTGQLPDERHLWAEDSDQYDAIATDGSGNALVLEIWGEQDSDFYNDSYRVLFVVEPDLLNNYGLAQASNAQLADEIFLFAGYEEPMPVVFDLTLNGLGGTTNLLTLAFRPPFLAATLCLILALAIVGWRAFRRFGPPVAERPAIDFGKQRLVTNGAGLILRARRTGLLAMPYAALSARRIQRTLGLTRADSDTLDEAIAARLPGEPSFSEHAAALDAASRPIDILRAARALHELERNLKA